MLLIKNGKLFLKDRFEYHDLLIENGRIVDIIPFRSCYDEKNEVEKVYDIRGSVVIPGMIDLEVHGACGYDMSDACDEAYEIISQYLLRSGVTGFVGAIDSFSEDILEEAYQASGEWMKKEHAGARMLGLHMKGPFLNPEAAGYHNKQALRKPDPELYHRLNTLSGGAVKIVSVSPELDGAYEFIREVSKSAHIALSNSNANYDTARMAFAYRADWCSDLFHDMPVFSIKDPGLAGAAMDAAKTVTLRYESETLVHPALQRMAYKECIGRICLVSGLSAFAGLKSGDYEIEGHTVTRTRFAAVLEDGTDAGGVLPLDSCLQAAMGMGGVPEQFAIQAVTETPARALGIYDDVGSIDVGKRADLAVLDLHGYALQAVFKDGVLVYDERNLFS